MARVNFRSVVVRLPWVVWLAACAPSPAAPPKTPTNDAEPPATTTSDGEVIGADRVAPAEKLRQGVSVDTNSGVKPAEHPPSE